MKVLLISTLLLFYSSSISAFKQSVENEKIINYALANFKTAYDLYLLDYPLNLTQSIDSEENKHKFEIIVIKDEEVLSYSEDFECRPTPDFDLYKANFLENLFADRSALVATLYKTHIPINLWKDHIKAMDTLIGLYLLGKIQKTTQVFLQNKTFYWNLKRFSEQLQI